MVSYDFPSKYEVEWTSVKPGLTNPWAVAGWGAIYQIITGEWPSLTEQSLCPAKANWNLESLQ